MNGKCRRQAFDSPPWSRRGGCAIKKMVPSLAAQTGAKRKRDSAQDQESFAQVTDYRMLNKPPRPLHQRRLRSIFLWSRPPRLDQGGESNACPLHSPFSIF